MVASLVDHSLLVQDESADGEPRFRMLETIREFALDQLEAAGEGDSARDNHAAYFLGLAEQGAIPEYAREEEPHFRRLEPELDNLRAALTWLLVVHDDGTEHARLGLRLAGALVRFWDTRGYLQEEAGWLERALARVPDEPTRERAVVLTGLGVNYWFARDVDRSTAYQEQALAIWRHLNAPKEIVRSLWFLGMIAAKHGDIARLETLRAECAPLAPTLGITLWQAVPYSLQALAALVQGDGQRATEILQPTLAYHAQHGYLWPHAWVLGVLAEAAMLERERPRALTLHQQSLAEFHQTGDIYATVDCLIAVADHATAFGQPDTAARLLGTVAVIRASIGNRLTWTNITEEDAINATRSALGEPAFDAARDSGRSLSLPDAMALAATVTPAAAAPSTPASAGDPFGLSPRELEVLRLLAEGKSNQELGDALFISHRTAGTHVTNILGKLDVNSRSAAVAVALNNGLL